jgi:hypothetical protein
MGVTTTAKFTNFRANVSFLAFKCGLQACFITLPCRWHS